MTTETACMAALAALVESTLSGVTCIKSRPNLARPDVTLPQAALWWQSSPLQDGARISASEDSRLVFGLTVLAKNEPDLLRYVALLRAAFKANRYITVSGAELRMTAQAITRLLDDETDATRYGCEVEISLEE